MRDLNPVMIAMKNTTALQNELVKTLAQKIFPKGYHPDQEQAWVRKLYQLIKTLRFEMSLGVIPPTNELRLNYRTLRFLLMHLAEARLMNQSNKNERMYTFDQMYAMMVSIGRSEWIPQFNEMQVQTMFEALQIRFKDMTDEYQFLLVMQQLMEKHVAALQ